MARNPLLNPAVLVFLFLVAAWQWGVVRLLVGALLVLGAGALAARVLGQTHARVPEQLLPQDVEVPPRPQQLPGRFVRSLGRLSAVLVPEYAVVVLLIGGEIPVLLALASLGAGTGMVGALLVTLPALSLPSMVMVGRALSPRVTVAMAGTVVVGGIVAALTLSAMT